MGLDRRMTRDKQITYIWICIDEFPGTIFNVFNRTHIYFYHTPALAEYSITSYIYVTESLRTTAKVCVAMTIAIRDVLMKLWIVTHPQN